MKLDRWFYLWCVLICGIISVSTLDFERWASASMQMFDANRWGHFLIYAAAVAVPVAMWQSRSRILLSIIPVMIAIVIDSLSSGGLFASVRAQIIPAELFGTVAGVLLGLNLRLMRRTKDPLGTKRSYPTRTVSF
jgi:hypothetical protein